MCDYGEGSFQITDSNENVIGSSDGFFGTYDVIDFCVENGDVNMTENRKDKKSLNLAKKDNSNN